MELTVRQYEKAIKEVLSSFQIEILITLYCNGKYSTALELSKQINPKAKGHISASGPIGKIGKALASVTKKIPEDYFDGRDDVPAFYSVVGIYDSMNGWQMWGNLKKALFKIIIETVPELLVKNRD